MAQPDLPAVDLSQGDLNNTQKAALWQLLHDYRSIFVNNISELGLAYVPPQVIDVSEAVPVYRYPYGNFRHVKIIEKKIQA